MHKVKIVILLTGTINPVNVPNLKRTDPVEREQDYFFAIQNWLKLGYPLLFVENSNFSSNSIDRLFDKSNNNEYIKFNGVKSYKGKGNGEAEIIKFAFENSEIIKKCDIVVKVTGRLFVKNFLDYISQIEDINDKFVISNFNDNLTFSDSRLIIGHKNFFLDYLLNDCNYINENNNVFFEHILARSIHRWLADGCIWHLPIRIPLFIGYSGTGNTKYKNSIPHVIKKNIMLSMLRYLIGLKP